MNYHDYPKSLYEDVTIQCKLCGDFHFYKNIPTTNLERKLCPECMRIDRRDSRNRRLAKLSLQAK